MKVVIFCGLSVEKNRSYSSCWCLILIYWRASFDSSLTSAYGAGWLGIGVTTDTFIGVAFWVIKRDRFPYRIKKHGVCVKDLISIPLTAYHVLWRNSGVFFVVCLLLFVCCCCFVVGFLFFVCIFGCCWCFKWGFSYKLISLLILIQIFQKYFCIILCVNNIELSICFYICCNTMDCFTVLKSR